ncbi:MAG: SAM-dependent methyltransferase, partial [Candidatus Promineifilaceae bacterium]
MMITIIGLGPGDPGQITIEALEKLKTAAPLFLRTARHPAVNHLTVGMQIKAFDYLYDSVASFDELYEK